MALFQRVAKRGGLEVARCRSSKQEAGGHDEDEGWMQHMATGEALSPTPSRVILSWRVEAAEFGQPQPVVTLQREQQVDLPDATAVHLKEPVARRPSAAASAMEGFSSDYGPLR